MCGWVGGYLSSWSRYFVNFIKSKSDENISDELLSFWFQTLLLIDTSHIPIFTCTLAFIFCHLYSFEKWNSVIWLQMSFLPNCSALNVQNISWTDLVYLMAHQTLQGDLKQIICLQFGIKNSHFNTGNFKRGLFNPYMEPQAIMTFGWGTWKWWLIGG